MAVEWLLGLDPGKKSDPPAIALIQWVPRLVEPTSLPELLKQPRQAEVIESTIHIRHLEMLTLRTSYVDLARRVHSLLLTPQIQNRIQIVMDVGGVGEPVADILREMGMAPITVQTIGDSARTHREVETGYNVPKRDLIMALSAGLDTGRIVYPSRKRLPIVTELQTQLENFHKSTTTNRNAVINAEREEIHDDLAIAAAIACWYGSRILKWTTIQVREAMTAGVKQEYNPLRGRRTQRGRREAFDPLRTIR